MTISIERFDTSTPAGRLLRNIMLTFAQFERELISERTRDKMFERVKKGLWNGGNTPYGYNVKDKMLVVNKKEARIVRLLYDVYVESGSLYKAFHAIKNLGLLTRKGNSFNIGTVEFVLRNVVYTGMIKYVGKLYPGKHDAIVSADVFKLAQATHKKRVKKFRVYKNYLFGGLIRCVVCGSTMTPTYTNKHKNGKLKRYYYYQCTIVSRRGWDSCSVKAVSSTRFEDYVMESFKRISSDKHYLENLVFRLNNGSKLGPKKEVGISGSCSEDVSFSVQVVKNVLVDFVSGVSGVCGVERNLLTKKFIKNIYFGDDEIKFELYYGVSHNVIFNDLGAGIRDGNNINRDGKKIINKDKKNTTINEPREEMEASPINKKCMGKGLASKFNINNSATNNQSLNEQRDAIETSPINIHNIKKGRVSDSINKSKDQNSAHFMNSKYIEENTSTSHINHHNNNFSNTLNNEDTNKSSSLKSNSICSNNLDEFNGRSFGDNNKALNSEKGFNSVSSSVSVNHSETLKNTRCTVNAISPHKVGW